MVKKPRASGLRARDALPLLAAMFLCEALFLGALFKAVKNRDYTFAAVCVGFAFIGGWVLFRFAVGLRMLTRLDTRGTDASGILSGASAARIRLAIRNNRSVNATDVADARAYVTRMIWPWWKILGVLTCLVFLATALSLRLGHRQHGESQSIVLTDTVFMIIGAFLISRQWKFRRWARRHLSAVTNDDPPENASR